MRTSFRSMGTTRTRTKRWAMEGGRMARAEWVPRRGRSVQAEGDQEKGEKRGGKGSEPGEAVMGRDRESMEGRRQEPGRRAARGPYGAKGGRQCGGEQEVAMERFVGPRWWSGVGSKWCRAQKGQKGGGGGGCSATPDPGQRKGDNRGGEGGTWGSFAQERACTVGAVAGRERGPMGKPKEPDEESKRGGKRENTRGNQPFPLSRTRFFPICS